MKFLADWCAGRRLAEWLRNNGHDVIEAYTLGPDPGDRSLLQLAAADDRILITTDKDFGELIYLHLVHHAGLIRLPDVRTPERIELIARIINRHSQALENRAIVTVRGGRIRISYPPAPNRQTWN